MKGNLLSGCGMDFIDICYMDGTFFILVPITNRLNLFILMFVHEIERESSATASIKKNIFIKFTYLQLDSKPA